MSETLFGSVYQPRHFRQGWEPKEGRCHASVSVGTWHSKQCERAAKVERNITRNGTVETHSYCGTHDPVKIAERRNKDMTERHAKLAEERRQHKREENEKLLRIAALDAIKQIANGHNDPRALALSVLAQEAPQ